MTRCRSPRRTTYPQLLHHSSGHDPYIGGKPRKGNKRAENKPSKRGRGTEKVAVMGVVERGGRVVAEPAARDKVTGKGLLKFLSRVIDMPASLLVTDELPAYHQVGRKMNHVRINHSVQYVDGPIHTNTIEGFWALVKRAWYGSHHHYSRRYMHLYIAEACYKYNKRNAKNGFDGAIAAMVGA